MVMITFDSNINAMVMRKGGKPIMIKIQRLINK